MELNAETVKPALTRLKRANGQLQAVVRMIEEGRSCEDVITQIAAVSSAIDRAAFAIIAQSMQDCARHGDDIDAKKLEKLFMSLR